MTHIPPQYMPHGIYIPSSTTTTSNGIYIPPNTVSTTVTPNSEVNSSYWNDLIYSISNERPRTPFSPGDTKDQFGISFQLVENGDVYLMYFSSGVGKTVIAKREGDRLVGSEDYGDYEEIVKQFKSWELQLIDLNTLLRMLLT